MGKRIYNKGKSMITDNSNQLRELVLKDGRIIYTKKNGFEYYVRSTKGVETKVTADYYTKALKLTV